MICPYCGNKCPDSAKVCSECNQVLPAGGAAEGTRENTRRRVLRIVLLCACWMLSLCILGVAVYKVYFWIDTYKINRVYGRGGRAPAVSEITLDDGRTGHAVTFFADDGDQVYIEELGRSYTIAGGFARIELPDSVWFDGDLAQIESAVVTLNPILIRESGDRMRLPQLKLEVSVPQSPLTVLSPAQNGIEINSAIYPLQLQVVPGSSVYINGNEVTDIADRAGFLTYNLNVYPIGDNVISILVRTPNHKETRRDVVIRRAEMEIELELSINTPSSSDTKTMTISGKCEPGATIAVDSPYVAESLTLDPETGEFKFLARFDVIGDNTVAFRAVKEGKQDSSIRFTVNYVPNASDYTSTAWKMEYSKLLNLYEQWKGRIFKCEGMVTDVFEEEGLQYIVMDVGTDGFQKLVVLINRSARTDIIPGVRYSAYADVEGRELYYAAYCPLLNMRYVYDAK